MNPKCSRIPQTTYQFNGYLAGYLTGVTSQWLEVAPLANPAMLEILRDRDRHPRRDLVPWAGEFAGKYLTSAVQVLRLTQDEGLHAFISDFVDRLMQLQDKDGYLGPWPEGSRFTGKAPNVGGKEGNTWDAWGHYHIMLGLLLWHEESGDQKSLDAVIKIADLICRKFLGNMCARLVDTGSTEMNLAVIHTLCLLHRKTKTERYLDMALQIVDEFAAEGADGPLAGDYLRMGLAGAEFHQTPKPRWESLHPIMGLAELYWITGEEKYRTAFEQIWWSIVKLDRHNNGGFSSGEQAQGNPYHQGAIETCCTIAWIATGVEMLRLTENSVVADEIELSTLNSVIGLHSHTGRWVTYNTPMDGVRRASAHDIVFQAREGSPELNCCSVNGPRGLGMISDWALMGCEGELVLNWYGPSTMEIRLASDITVKLEQETTYPREGKIALRVSSSRAAQFALKLRIPYWSNRTTVKVNGEPVNGVAAGTYLALDRQWGRADKVELELDMSPHYWVGEKECEGKVSMYRGPVLLTYDRRLNVMDPDDIPMLDATKMEGELIASDDKLPIIVMMEYTAPEGQKLRLCDFGSAGEGGSPYVSWLKVKHIDNTPFTPSNPLRSGRPQ
ncbi:MAG: glycoside hydrolase family 127 protein [Candidatus Poribacteria bacterium]|nr:glycoside hydrolase family 127 protein [Candidatus Poribacteria bacterium]